VNPKSAAVLNYYGYMLGDLGIRLDEAEALVQRALKEEPFSGAYLDSLGWIYSNRANWRLPKQHCGRPWNARAMTQRFMLISAIFMPRWGARFGRRRMGKIAERMAPSLRRTWSRKRWPSWKRSSRNRSVAWRRNPLRASRNLNQQPCLKSASRRTQKSISAWIFWKAHGWFSRTAHDFSDHFAAR